MGCHCLLQPLLNLSSAHGILIDFSPKEKEVEASRGDVVSESLQRAAF